MNKCHEKNLVGRDYMDKNSFTKSQCVKSKKASIFPELVESDDNEDGTLFVYLVSGILGALLCAIFAVALGFNPFLVILSFVIGGWVSIFAIGIFFLNQP